MYFSDCSEIMRGGVGNIASWMSLIVYEVDWSVEGVTAWSDITSSISPANNGHPDLAGSMRGESNPECRAGGRDMCTGGIKH